MRQVFWLGLVLMIALAGTVGAQPSENGLRMSSKSEQRICGHAQIRGFKLDQITSPTRGCGVRNPVSVTQVAGVRLNPPAMLDCQAARSLRKWVQRAVKPAFRTAGGIASMRVYDHYNCRTRNNVPGAKVSMHGSGQAIDIGSFTLRNNQTVSVLKHWNDPAWSRVLRTLHQKACGPFNTVLGPGYNAAHRNHFHFDTGGRGRFCR